MEHFVCVKLWKIQKPFYVGPEFGAALFLFPLGAVVLSETEGSLEQIDAGLFLNVYL